VGRFAPLCAALALLSAPSAALAAPHALVTGLVAGGGAYTGPQSDIAFSRISAAGATLVRIGLSWADVAPTRPANPRDPNDRAYHWSSFDAVLKAALAHGLKPLVSIDSAPAWAQDTSPPLAFMPPDPSLVGAIRPSPSEYGAFAHAAAERYDGAHGHPRVSLWRAWNEPNLSQYLLPQFDGAEPVSPAWYRSMANSFAAAVHAAHADNVVVAGSLAPFGARSRTAEVVSPLRFMRQFLCMSAGRPPHATCGARAHFDVWALHPYTSGGPTRHAANPDDVSLGDIPRVRALLDAADRAGRIVSRGPVGLWVAEFSWDTRPPDPSPHVVPVKLQARWVAEMLHELWLDRVTVATWLMLRDDPYPTSPAQSGLYFRGLGGLRSDAAKPALAAFRFPFVAYRRSRGVSVWGRTPAGHPAYVVVDQSSGGRWRTLAKLRTDAYGVFDRTLRLLPPARSVRTRAAPPPSYRDVVRRDSPEFYWRLDETRGPVARDDTGRRNAVYTGGLRSVPGALPGTADRGVALDGKGDRIDLGPISSPKTVELWLRTQSSAPTAAFSNRDATSDFTYLGLGDSVHALAFDGAALPSRTWVTDGRWHHLVYTYDGAVGRLYVDGRQDAAAAFRRAQGGDDALLGYDRTLRRYLKGSIDEVAVYDYALSAAQVRAHFLASGRSAGYADQFDVMQPGQTYLRARLANGGGSALPFSLTRPRDRFVLPFGI
jgi:Concanavalin A-like lectin/glucanases superfamily